MLRVVLSGVESAGKTVLARGLAQAFGGEWVPEFGRAFTEALDRPLTLADHHRIAEGHRAEAERAAARRPPLLVEDTDIVMTTAWATMLFGVRDPLLAASPSRADLHLLLMPDVPFVPDPVRIFAAPAMRARFHATIEAEFRARALVPVRIGGDFAVRRRTAMALVAEALKGRP